MFDTTLHLYDQGCSQQPVESIACDNDTCGLQSRIVHLLESGVTYWIRVAGYDGAKGTFTLSVPGGHGTYAPNLLGMTRDVAEGAILGAGLFVGAIREEFSDTVPAGVVMGQDPPAGSPMLLNALVHLVVSKGPPQGYVQATILPAEAVTDGAQWRVVTVSGDTVTGHTPGEIGRAHV